MVLQDIVDDQLRVVAVLLKTGQDEALSQVGQQVPDVGQQRLQLTSTHRAHWPLQGGSGFA